MLSADRSAPAFWWVACAAVAVIVRLLSPGILEGGDGVQHYQIAHYAWKHPELLLHHWGKPLFTLFASPFAQLGHWGMALFNAVCFVVTCWAADGILKRAGIAARWIFPPALLLVPVYGTMVLAGMTEVFFAMLAMLVFRALLDERYVVAMVIVSFMPFARPEYVAFAPFAIAWVAWKRQWRALPFILVGHVVYAIIGGEVFGDLLWAFRQDPYTGAENIYGSGPLLHFTDHIQNIYGWPLIWALAIALLTAVVLFVRQRADRPVLSVLVLLALLPSLAILVLHSLLWWKGLKGSLGLFRVMATCAPLVVLCALWPLSRAGELLIPSRSYRNLVAFLFGTAYTVAAAHAFLVERQLPVPEDPYERFVRNVGVRVGQLKEGSGRVACFHPYITFAAGLDPYDSEETVGVDVSRTDLGLRTGDLLVWDAHFGPNEAGLPLYRLLTDPDLRFLELMVPEERMTVLGGYQFEAYLFSRDPGAGNSRREEREVLVGPNATTLDVRFTKLDTMPCHDGHGTWCFGEQEYPLEFSGVQLQRPGLLYSDLHISADVGREDGSGEGLDLVFSEENAAGRVSYWSVPLRTGEFHHTFRIPPRSSDIRNKLYVWNHSRTPFRIKDLSIAVERTSRAQ